MTAERSPDRVGPIKRLIGMQKSEGDLVLGSGFLRVRHHYDIGTGQRDDCLGSQLVHRINDMGRIMQSHYA